MDTLYPSTLHRAWRRLSSHRVAYYSHRSCAAAHGGPEHPVSVGWNYSGRLSSSARTHLTLVSRIQHIWTLASHSFRGHHLEPSYHHLLPKLC